VVWFFFSRCFTNVCPPLFRRHVDQLALVFAVIAHACTLSFFPIPGFFGPPQFVFLGSTLGGLLTRPILTANASPHVVCEPVGVTFFPPFLLWGHLTFPMAQPGTPAYGFEIVSGSEVPVGGLKPFPPPGEPGGPFVLSVGTRPAAMELHAGLAALAPSRW